MGDDPNSFYCTRCRAPKRPKSTFSEQLLLLMLIVIHSSPLTCSKWNVCKYCTVTFMASLMNDIYKEDSCSVSHYRFRVWRFNSTQTWIGMYCCTPYIFSAVILAIDTVRKTRRKKKMENQERFDNFKNQFNFLSLGLTLICKSFKH